MELCGVVCAEGEGMVHSKMKELHYYIHTYIKKYRYYDTIERPMICAIISFVPSNI